MAPEVYELANLLIGGAVLVALIGTITGEIRWRSPFPSYRERQARKYDRIAEKNYKEAIARVRWGQTTKADNLLKLSRRARERAEEWRSQ